MKNGRSLLKLSLAFTSACFRLSRCVICIFLEHSPLSEIKKKPSYLKQINTRTEKYLSLVSLLHNPSNNLTNKTPSVTFFLLVTSENWANSTVFKVTFHSISLMTMIINKIITKAKIIKITK